MLKLLITKELKNIIASPKFTATFATCAILILLSVFIGIQEYQTAVRQYDTARQLLAQEIAETSSWMGISNRVFRKPDPMQIFSAGIHYDIGRFSDVGAWEEVKLRRSAYSDDPIFAIFRFIDFAFIVQVAMSLLAILFTYDAINGERERGTLKLTFANPVPRAQYILGKFFGSWLGLVIPVLIPMLLALLLVLLYQIPLTGAHWMKIISLFGISILFFTFFITFGLLVSALTRSSASSFLILLVSWVTLVLIIPRASVMIAGQFVSVPSVAEIESKQAKFEQERWDQSAIAMDKRFEERNAKMVGITKEEREAYEDENMWNWMQEEDAERKIVQQDITEYHRKLQEDLRNRRAAQEELAFMLSRFSPASAYQLAVMNLSGNGISLKTRYEDAMEAYRDIFVDFVEEKRKESGGHGGLRISISGEDGVSISTGDVKSLDVSELPQFDAPAHTIRDVAAPMIIDSGLLALYIALAFAGAFWGFVRYDVR